MVIANVVLALAATDPAILAPRELAATTVPAGAIRIDGVLDEPAWSEAPIADRFVQSSPEPARPATLRSEARVAVDDGAIYVALRLYDPVPRSIRTLFGRRDDEGVSDWAFVEIDSRRDRRTAFSFGVNPAGIQVDGSWYDDINYDASWNAVWTSAVRVDDAGWTVELRIPFTQLPFGGGGGPTTWGFNVYRSNLRSGEVANWSPRYAQLSGIVSRFNALKLVVPASSRRIELAPFAVAQLGGRGRALRAGVDANLGLSTDLALGATVLPDFGQVEADPAQLNLTAFELFQAERRPFFTEGVDALRFDTALPFASRDNSFADEAPFYSRRIGRAPRGAIPDGAALVDPTDRPVASTVLGAARLTGTVAGWRIGALAAATRREHAAVADPDGAEREVAIEPAAQAAIVRAVDQLRDGRAAIGAFASAVHHPGTGPELPVVRDALAAGADGMLRFADDAYEVRGWALASRLTGDPAAIDRLGREAWHLFQRADAPRLALAPGATELRGAAGEARLARIAGALQGRLALRAIAPGFDASELGFQRGSDWLIAAGQWSYRADPGGTLRYWRVGSETTGAGWSFGGERRAAVVDAFGELGLPRFWTAKLALQHELEALSVEWLRGGPGVLLPPRDSVRLSVASDRRRASTVTLDATAGLERGSDSRWLAIAPAASLRLSDHVLATLSPSYRDEVIGWQYVASRADAPDHAVARDHQRTLAIALRADVALTPHLIVQVYAQPFATTGAYTRYARLGDPRAHDPERRFVPYAPDELAIEGAAVTVAGAAGDRWQFARPDGAHRSLLASAIVRWEYAPGSFATAVWTHDAAADTATARSIASELWHAPGAAASDAALVKLSWLWSR